MQRLHARPVKLYRRPDGIRAAAKDRGASLRRNDIVFGTVVGQIEVIRLCRKLSCKRVYLFYYRQHAHSLTRGAHFRLRGAGKLGDTRVRESGLFCGSHEGGRVRAALQDTFHTRDVGHFFEEP